MRTPPKNEGFDMRPRVLDTDPHYKKLSPAAKELYTKLYSRACLSATKDDLFRDERGVYVIYTVDEARDQLNCGKDKAINTFKELEEAGLIDRERHGYGNPHHIYVKDLLGRLEKSTSNSTEKPTNTDRENRPMEVAESDENYNKERNSDLNNTDQVSPTPDWDDAEKRFKENVAYDILVKELPIEQLERIMRVLISKYCTTQTHIRIFSTDIPVQKVREEFLKLNDLHIRFVCDKLVHMTTEVKNMDAVCLNLLWNASLDIEIDAQTAFNRDYAAGKI